MKSKYIQWLVIGSSAAMLGLIAIQVYWISNVFTLREQEFSEHVNEALMSISVELENEEAQANSDAGSMSLRAPTRESLVINRGDGEISVVTQPTFGDDSVSVDPLAAAGVNTKSIETRGSTYKGRVEKGSGDNHKIVGLETKITNSRPHGAN